MDYNDFEELSKIAYARKDLSEFAPLPVRYMYMQLSNLYDNFADNKYTKEKCIELKNKLRKEYTDIMKEHWKDMECHRDYLEKRRENSMLIIQLEKSRNEKEMLDTCLKIVANCVGDKSLYERNIKKTYDKGQQLDF